VLVDGVAPTITSVTGPTAGTYIVGQNLDFTVVFSEAVAVTGTPRLQLTIGSTTRYATYLSGTGTSTLTFRYTVQAGDEDTDGIAVASPIDLNGGTIKDVPGNNAVLTFTPPNTSGVLVDGVAPTITSVSGPAAGTYIVGQHLDFTVQFDETVVVDTTGGTPRLELTIGSTTRYATYLSGTGHEQVCSSATRCNRATWTAMALLLPRRLTSTAGRSKTFQRQRCGAEFHAAEYQWRAGGRCGSDDYQRDGAGCRHLHRRAEPRFHGAVQRGGGSYRHTAAGADHRQHDPLRHLRLRQRFGKSAVPLHGAGG
jgi:hypothetical protein